MISLTVPAALLEPLTRLMLHPAQRHPEHFTEQELDAIDAYLDTITARDHS